MFIYKHFLVYLHTFLCLFRDENFHVDFEIFNLFSDGIVGVTSLQHTQIQKRFGTLQQLPLPVGESLDG